MSNKQTAVEWLEQEFIKLESTIGVHGVMYELLDQAKEMENQTKEIHKQEIIKAAARGYLAMPERFNLEEAKDYGQQYYDNICGGNENE
jgi:hypothetical protein